MYRGYIHWLDGKKEYIKGTTLPVAMRSAGIGNGGLKAIDFIREIESPFKIVDGYELVKVLEKIKAGAIRHGYGFDRSPILKLQENITLTHETAWDFLNPIGQ